jgi:hypothetical protein
VVEERGAGATGAEAGGRFPGMVKDTYLWAGFRDPDPEPEDRVLIPPP